MIGKLKTESGYHWTSKLEDMFKDIQRSMLERTVGAGAEAAREDLARLYRLYASVPGGNNKIADSVKVHICSLGNSFIQKSKEAKGGDKSDHELIRSLIELHD